MRVVLVAVGLALVGCALRQYTRRVALLLILVVLAALTARRIPGIGQSRGFLCGLEHCGIAPPTPVPFLILGAALFAILVCGTFPRPIGDVVLPGGLCGLLLLMTTAVWEGTPAHWSGLLALATAAVAWTAGRCTGYQSERSDAGFRWTLVVSIAFALIQVGVSIQQIGTGGEALYDEISRASGIFGHPAFAGRMLIALVALMLPGLSADSSAWSRRGVASLIALSTAAIGLSGARANIAALMVLLVAWAAIAPSHEDRVAARRMCGVGVLALTPFIGVFVNRMRVDPDGGSRPILLDLAWQQIQRAPLTGTGPNGYVEALARVTGGRGVGMPVHNSYLLVVAELGVPIALLIAFLVCASCVRVLMRREQGGGAYSSAFFCLILAAVPIALTGWGILQVTSLPLFGFVLGHLSAQSARGASKYAEDCVARELASVGSTNRGALY